MPGALLDHLVRSQVEIVAQRDPPVSGAGAHLAQAVVADEVNNMPAPTGQTSAIGISLYIPRASVGGMRSVAIALV